MNESYFTEQEYLTLLLDHVDGSAPISISHVSQTQLSVARHYGGCTYDGKPYIYNYNTDELIREDIMKAVEKMRKKENEQQRTR